MHSLAFNQIIGYVIICFGILFDFFGVLGLLRLPDVYNRLQAATKCVTFGSAGILIGVFIYSGFTPTGFKAILCTVFILLTSPVSAHAIAKAAHNSGIEMAEETIVDHYLEDMNNEPTEDK
ncbi:MAG: monovalent cation/H(+) antiporter subunit G [Candidatus Cloacimonetes bacterium]|nr:monovalent cation/H(+) antiporter subunit G [Candidatus Cloacimonadota bacterium]MBS3767208.1 monovalent cation/H(+) antiporter subunit G [Candidatus Cloacimonadota bacterium]